jgi:Transglutaminase-like superfamily
MNKSLYRVSPDTRFSNDQDSTTILNIGHGRFYDLIGKSSIVWQQIVVHPEGITLEKIVRHLITREAMFANEPREKVTLAVSRLLDILVENGLIETSEHPSPRVLGSVRRFVCIVTAGLTRWLTNLLIELRLPCAAVALEFVIFQVIYQIGDFPARHYIVKHWPVNLRRLAEPKDISLICFAVNAAIERYSKESLCLQKASVTVCLLRQYGIPAEMKIGVHSHPFSSHAWVEVAGTVINDDKDVQRYFKVIDVW